jgi:NADH:ubiquinone oxidoreductase subunit 6 (subunit J)
MMHATKRTGHSVAVVAVGLLAMALLLIGPAPAPAPAGAAPGARPDRAGSRKEAKRGKPGVRRGKPGVRRGKPGVRRGKPGVRRGRLKGEKRAGKRGQGSGKKVRSAGRGARRAKKQARRASRSIRRAIFAKAGEKARYHATGQVSKKAGTHGLAGAREKRGAKKPSWLSLTVFFLLAFGCAGFAVVMITRKSPMMSAMSLLVVFLCLAGLYVFLNAPFMAAIQLIVYAGAIVVLFIFVIMSMGLKTAYGVREMRKDITYFLSGFLLSTAAALFFFYGHSLAAYLLAGVLILGCLGIFILGDVSYTVARFLGVTGAAFAAVQIIRVASLTSTYLSTPAAGEQKLAPLTVAQPLREDFGGAQVVGRTLFRDNAFAFEALSLLLLAAIVAAVVVVRSREEKEAAES